MRQMEDGTPQWPGNSCVTPHVEEARRTLERVGDTWTLVVIHMLGHGPTRFSALRRLIPDISQRMLSRTLRLLERDGLVTRTVYPTNPPSVEYALTAMGRSMGEAVTPLIEWTGHHRDELVAAREAYDRDHEPLLGRAAS
jgi:DNA-binding HxlR family transcriptional regulator